jgi:hypothetical protein
MDVGASVGALVGADVGALVGVGAGVVAGAQPLTPKITTSANVRMICLRNMMFSILTF